MRTPTRSVLASVGPIETADRVPRLLDALERYAGWLSHSGTGVPGHTLRAHVRALRDAVDAGTDPWMWIQLIDTDVRRLPGGEIPKMLRRTLAEITTVLESSAPREGDGPS